MTDTGIFKTAIKLPADQRAAFLDEACGSNQELRREVESLLRAHEKSESFLERPAVAGATVEQQPITERPGTVIGPYKLIEQIGDGGFGVVFMAEQQHPVRRTVALKILKPGMDTRQVVARFEAERQALAVMDHPNIARVLDGGETATGRPYFVMELVKGIPISQYCDEQQLTPRERLALFVDVCHALQHAHQKGIIHRDLKPSNVLVAAYDGKPVPKVIDFGVAKAIGARVLERTQLTGFGAIIGTLEYMSPEQAEFNALDVDTRADIYGLGVLLYELLTGTTPLTKERLKQAAMTEALRLIREEDPPKPSTRLTDSKDSLASISAQRKLEPARLTKEVRGDLDWIVMKALEKDRNRRYETANGLARDVERYLQDEPVEACPPSALYRMRKFVRRNKGPALATTLLLLAIVAGMIGTTFGLVEARRQRDIAAAAATSEKLAKESAEAREAETKAVLEFVENQVFAAGRPLGQERGLGRDVTLRKAMEAAVPRVEGSFPDQPLIEARLLMTIGTSFLYLGDAKTAERLFLRARELRTKKLGPRAADTLQTMNSLGNCLHVQGRFREATTLHEETLRIQEATLGPDHPDTLRSMGNLANTYAARAQIPAAIDLLEKTLQRMRASVGEAHPDTVRAMNNLARFYTVQKRHDEARELLEHVLRYRKEKHSDDHPDTLRSAWGLSQVYTALGLHAEAAKLLEDTLRRQEAILSRDHADTLRTIQTLAYAYAGLDRRDDALKLYEEALERRQATFGPRHFDTLDSMNDLANYYATLGRHEEAAKLREGMGQQRPTHPDKRAKP